LGLGQDGKKGQQMKVTRCIACVPVIILLIVATVQAQVANAQPAEVFREPFTLQLHVDNGLVYEERFSKAPYLAASSVFLFAGDNFGVNVTIDGDAISAMRLEKDAAKADVAFKFTQEKGADGKLMMLLVLQNRLKRPLVVDGFMTVPGKKGIYKTRILPVRSGLGSYEAWPHPIVQLVLTNLRLAQQ
jgi:hypothetical protein